MGPGRTTLGWGVGEGGTKSCSAPPRALRQDSRRSPEPLPSLWAGQPRGLGPGSPQRVPAQGAGPSRPCMRGFGFCFLSSQTRGVHLGSSRASLGPARAPSSLSMVARPRDSRSTRAHPARGARAPLLAGCTWDLPRPAGRFCLNLKLSSVRSGRQSSAALQPERAPAPGAQARCSVSGPRTSLHLRGPARLSHRGVPAPLRKACSQTACFPQPPISPSPRPAPQPSVLMTFWTNPRTSSLSSLRPSVIRPLNPFPASPLPSPLLSPSHPRTPPAVPGSRLVSAVTVFLNWRVGRGLQGRALGMGAH